MLEAIQIGLFVAPTVLSGAAFAFDKLAGQKTNINLGLGALLAGLAAVDYSFIPGEYAAPLVSGLGIAGLFSNTKWTSRK
jgi:hypothetical protein